jgi:hypothetical protein
MRNQKGTLELWEEIHLGVSVNWPPRIPTHGAIATPRASPPLGMGTSSHVMINCLANTKRELERYVAEVRLFVRRTSFRRPLCSRSNGVP